MSSSKKLLSIIIVSYKNDDAVKHLLHILPKREDWEIIVINNTKDNVGFGAGCNRGAEKARGEYVLFLNADVDIRESAIHALLSYMQKHPNVGVVGPQYYYENGAVEQTSTCFPTMFYTYSALSFLHYIWPFSHFSQKYWIKTWDRKTTRNVDVVSGAVMMMRKKDFYAIGKFDERFFLYWEEFDICKRMSAIGKHTVFIAEAKVTHQREGSIRHADRDVHAVFEKSRWIYMKKHLGFFQALVIEFWLRLTAQWQYCVLFFLSLYLRVSNIFFIRMIGDLGRDYVQALSMIEGKTLPLLGIPSSVPRFSQGPFNIWFDAISFLLGGRSPFSPVLFAGILTSFGACFLYSFLAKCFEKKTAFFVTLLFVTSPAAVLQSRMPFYLFAIPVFTTFFLWAIHAMRKEQSQTIFMAVLSFCVLFQWELATLPLSIILLVVFLRNRVAIKQWKVVFGALCIGLFPQIVFDLTHNCAQLCGIGIWSIYRIFATTGFDGRHGVYSLSYWSHVFYEFVRQFSFLWSVDVFGIVVSCAIFLFMIYGFYSWIHQNKRHDLFLYAFVGICALFLGIFIHGSPSEAYFPPFLVLCIVALGYAIYWMPKVVKCILYCCIVGVAIFNTVTLTQSHFFTSSILPMIHVSRWIVQTAKDKPIKLWSFDEGMKFETYLDDYKFLIHIFGGNVSSTGKQYVISRDGNDPKAVEVLHFLKVAL